MIVKGSYADIMERRGEILKRSTGIDYEKLTQGKIAFDYEGLFSSTGYSLEDVRAIQKELRAGNTPLLELKNITRLVRKIAPKGKGARIFVKDEAANPSGSFKYRRASMPVYHAKKSGYEGVAVATSGNYGAAVASVANVVGVKCIVIQEVFDSRGIGQPEIIEKGRKCEAYGAEVLQMTVGPELQYMLLRVLDETGFFSAGLYTPYAVLGIETLGYEIGTEILNLEGRPPDAVVITHAGGGNITGTARGLQKADCKDTQIIAASVDLSGLHMASDTAFNRKSFTTGHTGFGVPTVTWHDRMGDVPRNACRPLRYMDRYVTVTQGEVFYVTEMLAQLEGLERGPAGNTSLAAAIALAREMDEDQILIINETEYTGAGKHPSPQLTFARQNNIEIRRGDPVENVPGKVIVIPSHPSQMRAKDLDLQYFQKANIRNSVQNAGTNTVSEIDVHFMAEDIQTDPSFVRKVLSELDVQVN
ncbi:MAG: 2-amino-4-oxopentanoate thiolase subunit OrtB [Candidatus Hodarchaeota archaeon]